MQRSILIADDDPSIRNVIAFALKAADFATLEARDGAEALKVFHKDKPDLVVLDIGMPEVDGLDVCRDIRRVSETPVLFLTARDEEIDRILGLEMGGDDYVTKPFSPRELVARIKAILKRVATLPAPAPAPVARGGLTLDPGRHVATFQGGDLGLTALEFSILETFLSTPDQVLSRDRIMTGAYPGAIHVSDRTIDSHVRNIRGKLARAGCRDAIETVHGVGFRLGACLGDAAPVGP